jgi:small neutral amino acid transporter SnatA (MarC family)
MLPQGGIAEWAGPLGLVIHHALLLFAVVNPIGNIPVYADLTHDMGKREQARVMNLAVLTALFVVVVFALIGDWSLVYLFNVNVFELEIAGGILLFIVALRGILPHGELYPRAQDRVMVAVTSSSRPSNCRGSTPRAPANWSWSRPRPSIGAARSSIPSSSP